MTFLSTFRRIPPTSGPTLSLFQVDADGALTEVAGRPPDAFAADGQLWGNPLYNWDVHLKTGCAWWILDGCAMQAPYTMWSVSTTFAALKAITPFPPGTKPQ